MKVYISTDLEGISGVCVFEQTRDRTTNLYQEARHLLMADITATVNGCLAGGATEVVVLDGHGGGFNFVPELMHSDAFYVTGVQRPRAACGLDESFHGVILLGYHAMNGVETGVLHHTQSSKAESKYWYNDRESGEIAQTALIAGHYGVPVIMVSGDVATCAEAKEFLGHEVETVPVKEGYSRQSCKMVAPGKAHEMLRAGATRAVRNVSTCKPYTIDFPATVRVQFGSKEIADGAKFQKAQRVDDTTYEATIDSALEAIRF